ncbi:tyrosine-type recombinase/integrase [Lentilactobacillus buchneri]|uniref:tyrosine-type recombinase/integrase n=1 Tax=Lentilactobacillus buchneri TaxID=1581 RepID=UPI0021A50BDF|nr:site-specific integrase [Lentilactobacillus buchneri]MCT2882626.1 site-specific integrase [Lentilactobacillus buchneri]
MARGSIRKKDGYYYYSFEIGRKDGKRRRVERSAGTSKQTAEKLLRRALSEYESGGKVPVESNMSADEYFKFWYENYVLTNLKKNTQKNYLGIINVHLIPAFGIYPLKNISPAMIQDYLNQLGNSQLSKHTCEIIQTVLRKSLKMAVFPYQLIKDNPTIYTQLPTYNQDRTYTRQKLKLISMDQFEQIMDITPQANPIWLPIQISFNTGLRRGEVCGLQWDCIDFDKQTLQVKRNMQQFGHNDYEVEAPKSQASYRTIMIGQTLINILKDVKKHQMVERLRYGKYYTDSNFVCTHENGKPVLPNSIKYYCSEIQKKLGFPFSFHSLRHTHATLLLENGATMKEVQHRLGHAKITTTMDTYAHVTKKMQTDTIDIFEKMMQKRELLGHE